MVFREGVNRGKGQMKADQDTRDSSLGVWCQEVHSHRPRGSIHVARKSLTPMAPAAIVNSSLANTGPPARPAIMAQGVVKQEEGKCAS